MSIRVAYELPIEKLLNVINMKNIKLGELSLVRSILSKSKLTEEDVKEMGNKIKKAIAERYK